jgi:hypothetical protein
MIRAGYNIPEDFGAGNIDSVSGDAVVSRFRWGGYVFAGLEGRFVGYNIFLEGNTYRESHGVDKRWFVVDGKIGATAVLKRVELTYAFIFRSKEFLTQEDHDAFASISLRMRF